MEFKYEKNRVFAEDDNGKLLAEATFPDCGEGKVVIERTFVAPELRGRNVASELMLAAYREIKAQGKRAELSCPYAVKWFGKRAGTRDILA